MSCILSPQSLGTFPCPWLGNSAPGGKVRNSGPGLHFSSKLGPKMGCFFKPFLGGPFTWSTRWDPLAGHFGVPLTPWKNPEHDPGPASPPLEVPKTPHEIPFWPYFCDFLKDLQILFSPNVLESHKYKGHPHPTFHTFSHHPPPTPSTNFSSFGALEVSEL